MNLVKSKHRAADHGEVFTPAWMVEAMLDLVKDETGRIDARFLEPACGRGNFLVQILRRRLAEVELEHGKYLAVQSRMVKLLRPTRHLEQPSSTTERAMPSLFMKSNALSFERIGRELELLLA